MGRHAATVKLKAEVKKAAAVCAGCSQGVMQCIAAPAVTGRQGSTLVSPQSRKPRE
jgi:hypothetical protein